MTLQFCRNMAAIVLLSIALGSHARAQDAAPQNDATPNPGPDYALLRSMAACDDMKCLEGYRDKVGDRKLAKIVFYEKWFLLEPSKVAGEGLLRNMPMSQAEQQQLMGLAEWHEDGAKSEARSEKDQKALATIYQNWPRSVADAVVVFPQFLPVYIRYGLLATNDVHSDYTGNEERVCRNDPKRFQAAFDSLDRKTYSHLTKTVFDPYKCRAIFVSDAE